jgi:hypothetical protein
MAQFGKRLFGKRNLLLIGGVRAVIQQMI